MAPNASHGVSEKTFHISVSLRGEDALKSAAGKGRESKVLRQMSVLSKIIFPGLYKGSGKTLCLEDRYFTCRYFPLDSTPCWV